MTPTRARVCVRARVCMIRNSTKTNIDFVFGSRTFHVVSRGKPWVLVIDVKVPAVSSTTPTDTVPARHQRVPDEPTELAREILPTLERRVAFGIQSGSASEAKVAKLDARVQSLF